MFPLSLHSLVFLPSILCPIMALMCAIFHLVGCRSGQTSRHRITTERRIKPTANDAQRPQQNHDERRSGTRTYRLWNVVPKKERIKVNKECSVCAAGVRGFIIHDVDIMFGKVVDCLVRFFPSESFVIEKASKMWNSTPLGTTSPSSLGYILFCLSAIYRRIHLDPEDG